MNRAVAMSDEELLLQRRTFVQNMLADTELTARQRDVAAFLVLGVSRNDITLRLGIRPYTLQSHIRTIYNKFAIHNIAGLSGIIIARMVDRLVEQEQMLGF